MEKRGKPFEKGNSGKPKGAETKTNKRARELFIEIMEGEIDNIRDSLNEIRGKDKGKYLEVLSKFFPYFIPKKIDMTTDAPIEIIIKDESKY